MAKLYKLTDENGRTQNNTQWGDGITHTATGDPSQDLCSDAWIHAYTDPLLGVFLNPAHFTNPRLYEAEGEIAKTDRGLKVGCRTLTTIKQIPVPKITLSQRVAFALLCARSVYKEESFQLWSQKWLSGEDRTSSAAYSAACSAAYSAADSAYSAASSAAYSAADSAYSAASSAADSAYSAASSAARSATYSAADSAYSAASSAQLDLISIANEALKY